MQIESKIIEIENTKDFSVEYVESQLQQRNIEPLRWAIVDINEKTFSINVAYETIT